jgi:ribulose-5-phosphate 4-epimerase/fuculose-1-phosphate aldolase
MRPELNEEDLRRQLTAISLRTYNRGLVRGSGGNVSARLDERTMLITASGLTLGDTMPDNIVTVDLETREWEAREPFIPSKEYHFHSEIYQARPDVNAIVHCHPPYATAHAVRRMDIPYVTDAAFKQPPMPHVSFSPSGSAELAREVREAAESSGNFRVMLLDEHGIVGVGSDLMQAFIWADLAEEMAQIALLASFLG